MIRRIATLFMAMFFALTASAQQYSMDAELIRLEGNTAIIRCSGTASSKKDAIEMAKKSAIYTYIYSGIDGIDGGRPLITSQLNKVDQEYVDGIFSTMRYASFINMSLVNVDYEVKVAKQMQVTLTLGLYHEALRRTLEKANILKVRASSLDEVTDHIAMPTVMVVPFCQADETYEEVFNSNKYMRMIIAKVNEGFIENGVETKDLITCLNNAETYRLLKGEGMTLEDAILINSGADISVKVDISSNTTSAGTEVYITMNAIEIATGNTLGSVSEKSARKQTSAEAICGPMAKSMIKDLLDLVATRMVKKTSTGQSISLRFTIDPSSVLTMETEINDELPLADMLVIWVKQHAQKGRYQSPKISSRLLTYSDVFIDNSVEDGVQMDVTDFARELYIYLKSLDLTISRSVKGNSINVVIY
jgi:hypothetical protein